MGIMKIISLVENTSLREEIKCEHGLSLFIEACGKRILFDMGQSDLFLENAGTLGIDIKAVDIAVLSHGHYDHGGGLGKFLEINEGARVYIRKNAFLPHYNGEKYIGIDPSLENNSRIIITEGDFSLAEGLTLCSPDFKSEAYGRLTVKRGEKFLPDPFDHEQYLLIEENGKRVLISGCSHRGILTIAEYFKPDVLIGGFHFMDTPLDERLAAIGRRLDLIDCDFYTCHCTGVDRYEFLTQYVKRIGYLSSGDEIAIE